jgi:hypothetical protein
MQGIAAIVEAWLAQRRVGAIAPVIGANGAAQRMVRYCRPQQPTPAAVSTEE